ncbi:hypothetical protein ACFLTZ_02705 [Chloroflexota bacterium]
MKALINWGWCPISITALAVVGYILEWPTEVVAPVLVVILIIGLAVVITRSREKELELSSQRLRQLAGYFNRRFMGNSSLSIFTIIDSLFNMDNPKLWEWARSCDMAQRIFGTWCDSFLGRVESDIKTRQFHVYLRTYLNELWLITTHYHEFIEQFYEVAEKVEIPMESIDQYNRLVVEYNTFIQSFRDNISGLKKIARTEIEPPSIKLARELPVVR